MLVTTSPAPVSLRLASLDDAESIRAIYNHEVEHTVATMDLVPRTLDDQRAWLAERAGAFGALVAVGRPGTDFEGEVVGFGALSSFKERPAYRTTVEDSVYVRRDVNGTGIGSMLLESLLDLATNAGFHSVIARIEAGGQASLALHARCGFELVGVEREVGRKFNRWLDVAIMQCMLDRRRH